MENNIAVKTQSSPSELGSLTAQAAASSPNGDAFGAVLAGHSRTDFFQGFAKNNFRIVFTAGLLDGG
jgi:hypothetical protein